MRNLPHLQPTSGKSRSRGKATATTLGVPYFGTSLVPSTPVRTLLVQDRIPANQPVQRAIERCPAIALLGTVWTLERVHQAMRMQSPELVVVDWNLAAATASHVCNVIKVRLLAPKVIAVVPTDDLFHRHGAALAGADTLIPRHDIDAGFESALALLFPDRAPN